MKLALILEAKLNRPWLEKQLGKDNPAVQKIVNTDPTEGSYYQWLTSLYKKRGSDDFLTRELRADIDEWDRNKQALKNLEISSDLNGKDLTYLADNLESLRYDRALRASTGLGSGVYHLSKDYPGAKILLNDGQYILFEIAGKDAASIDSLERLGMGTSWCTRKGSNISGAAQRYLNSRTQYVLYRDKKPLYQFDDKDFMNARNENVIPERDAASKILDAMGYACNEALMVAQIAYGDPKSVNMTQDMVNKYKQGVYRFDGVTGFQRIPALEAFIKSDMHEYILYATQILKRRVPEIEEWFINSNNKLRSHTEVDVDIQRYFTDHLTSYLLSCCKFEEWPEGEELLKENMATYTRYFVQRRTQPNVLIERSPELEKWLLAAVNLVPVDFVEDGNLNLILNYLWDLKVGEWPEGEKRLLNSASLEGLRYAIHVHKRSIAVENWLAAECSIFHVKDYVAHVTDGKPIPDFEDKAIAAMKSSLPTKLRDGQYPYPEPVFAARYALEVLKRRWPAAENIISLGRPNHPDIEAYFKEFNNTMGHQGLTNQPSGRTGMPGQKPWALYSESK